MPLNDGPVSTIDFQGFKKDESQNSESQNSENSPALAVDVKC